LLLISFLGGNVAFGAPSTPGVTIHFTVPPNNIQWDRSHTFLIFVCHVMIDNQTTNSLKVANLFQDHGGLAMKVKDSSGTELANLYSGQFHIPAVMIAPGSSQEFWPYYGPFRPGYNKTVKLQFEGKLNGSGYNQPVTSDVVEINVPETNP